MKKLRHRLTSYLLIPSALFLCSCDKSFAGKKASLEEHGKSMEEVSSKTSFAPPLQQVSRHLDMNGRHFSVTNVDGDLESLCKFFDGIISASNTSELPIPKEFSLRKILLKSGLNQITAKGESSREMPQYWHNRTFYATGGHRDGVLSILGGKGKPFVVGEYAPAGADLVFETELNLKQIRDLAEFISGEFGGEAQRNVSQALNQKLMGGAMSLADMLGKFDVRFSCALTLDNKHSWKTDGVELPYMDFVARLDHGVWLWNEYGKEVKKNLKVESYKGVKIYSAPKDISSPMGKLRPVLVVDEAKDQIWFAMSKASYLACLDGKPKLGASASFQTATAGLSESGNMLGYISPECCSTLIGLVQKGIEENADRDVKQSISSVLLPIVKKLNESSGYAITLANLDDGILITANAPFSTNVFSLTSAQVPVMMTLTSTLFIGAQAYKNAADRAACILNIRNIHQAVRVNMNIEDLQVGDPIHWEDIVGKGKFLETMPVCPLDGKRYILSKKYPPVGEAAAKCPNAQSKNHKPQSTEGW